jgi:hypothetical protein
MREVHDRLQENQEKLPAKLRDGLWVQMTAVADLIRNYRNDAGHAVATEINQTTCFISLAIFPAATERMYKLKEFLSC